jgi:hypothetical protein
MNRVREALQGAAVHAILVARPDAATLGEAIDCFENLGSKSVGREHRDGDAGHSEYRRALASLHRTGCVAPARSPMRRRRISSRHVSEILGSALVSRLERVDVLMSPGSWIFRLAGSGDSFVPGAVRERTALLRAARYGGHLG